MKLILPFIKAFIAIAFLCHAADCDCGDYKLKPPPFKEDKCKKRGSQGPTGPQGPPGPRGPTGATGATGSPGNGAIIPFAGSGNIGNSPNNTSPIGGTGIILGFGKGVTCTIANPLYINISETGGNASIPGLALSMPRSGTITAISAYFCYTGVTTNLTGPVTIQAQIFESTTPNDDFYPIQETLLNLSPTFTGIFANLSIATGSLTGLNIPIAMNSRIIIVFYTTTPSSNNLFSGIFSAGVNIE